ncbi:hypothetical protein EYF80_041275 [Liparis tanakae]|uniref:Uncharacterized protein n=1 Tax=Liparis tanakae TaxID=230148 RepID=A0A4Z2G5L3_9TELE|nr:hypothetical protein EYF80_041275 [Liparis tanakae]
MRSRPTRPQNITAAYPLITEGEGRDPEMTITRSETRFMKGPTRFRGNPKWALQIIPACNTAAVQDRCAHRSLYLQSQKHVKTLAEI